MKKIAPPPHLSADGKRLWIRLSDDYVLDDSGAQTLLRALCEALDRCEQARRRIRKDGAYLRDRFGQMRPHPAVAVERDSRNQILAAIKALRLEPEDVP